MLLTFLLISTSFARLIRRETSQTLYIPLTVDENKIYSVKVNMSSGVPQSFSFAITTSTGYSTVAGLSCTSCNSVPSYNQSASSSAVSEPGVQGVISTLGASASGSVVREDCTLHETNGQAWSYPNQPIIVANQSQGLFTSDISGIFGLGNNARDGNFNATVYAGFLQRNPSASNFSFGMSLNPPTGSSRDGGQLHWLAPDPSAYTGDVCWKSMTPSVANNGNTTSTNNSSGNSSSSTNATFTSDWTITMESFAFSAGGVTVSPSGGNLTTILDPYFVSISFPQSQTNSIYSAIPGSSIVAQSEFTNIYSVPCDTEMSLNLTFGSFSVPLDETSLILQENGQCRGVIEEWLDPTNTQYLLGSSVISKFYLIFVISSAQNAALGLAQKAPSGGSSSSKLRTAAIVGVILGSIAFAAVALAGVFLLFRARQRQVAKKKKTNHIPPFPQGSGLGPTPPESAALLGSTNPSPLSSSSPSWPGLPSSSSFAALEPTRHLSTLPATIHLTTSDESMGSPPPYVVTTKWPRQLPVVPMASPPTDRKRRL